MKILFTLLILSLSAFAVEDEKTMITRMVKERKEELKLFRDKVSNGKKCKLRNYECFKNEVMLMGKGQAEDIMLARYVLEPFYLRSIKEGDTPCGGSCLQNMLAYHIDTLLSFTRLYDTTEKKNYRVSAYPTIDATRIRAVMDLSAIGATIKNGDYLSTQLKKLKPEQITDKEVKDISRLQRMFDTLASGKHLAESILCHLHPGDLVYDEIMYGEKSKKQSDKNLAEWMKTFNKHKTKVCKSTTPLDYRGQDESTKNHYAKLRDQKLVAMETECKTGDYGCIRKHLREMDIYFADDIVRVKDKLIAFEKLSTPSPCDEDCQAQILISKIQAWVTYYSNFDRSKLASTMDEKIYPEAKYDAIAEDIVFFDDMKAIFTPMVVEFGKIDTAKITDVGMKSEMRSIGKDLSDLASAKLIKDSIICKMDPWLTSYDKYLSPYKDRKMDQKFEEAFFYFKSSVCK